MDEERMEAQAGEREQPLTWKQKLYSEKFMKYINGIFILMIVLGMPQVTVIGYGLWLVYLICGIIVRKETTMRIAYGVLGIFALAVIVLNLLSLF